MSQELLIWYCGPDLYFAYSFWFPFFDESFCHSLAQISFPWGNFPIHPDVREFPSNWRRDATSPWLNPILNSAGSFAQKVPSQ